MKLDKWLMCQLQQSSFDSWKKIKASQEINISDSGASQSVLQMFPLGSWRGGLLRVHSSQTAGTRELSSELQTWAQRGEATKHSGQKSIWEAVLMVKGLEGHAAA